MKCLALSLSLSFICNSSFSQTYLTPSIGYDFMSMKSIFIEPDFHAFEVLSPPYSIDGLQYGLEIEQSIFNGISASANLCYTKRKVDAITYGFAPYDGFKFSSWRGNISLSYKIANFMSISAGYDYNQLKNVTYTRRERSYTTRSGPSMIDRGLNVSIRGYWKNIEFKGYFHKGINSNISDSPLELSIKPINYFGVSLGYRIKIINAFKKGKKAECPKF